MKIDREVLLQNFLAESEEGLARMEAAALAMESNPEDADAFQEIFRVVHTLKGNAAALGFVNLRNYAHEIENGLDQVRGGTAADAKQLVTILLKLTDSFRQILSSAAIANNDQPSLAHQQLAVEFRDLVSSQGEKPSETQPVADLLPVQTAISGKSLRVDVEKLNWLLDLTGELTIAQERLRIAIESIGEPGRMAAATFVESMRLLGALQDGVMSVRMVPIDGLFRQYMRTVRDLAHSEGKLAQLVIQADDVEVDTTIIEHLKDPLMHMIRNAIAHGIEKPDARRAAGKLPAGTITLSASQSGGTIAISIKDDGRGFDLKRILERARELGMARPAEEISEQQLLRYVLEPGFSTAESVSELSGRGVGMDVVRRNVTALRGAIQVENLAGAGSEVILRVPLTVAIIDGFSVEAGGEVFIIPMDRVVSCMELPADRLTSEGSGVITVQGVGIPFIRLRHALGVGGTPPEVENVLIVEYLDKKIGIVADQLLGEQQTVVKPLGSFFPDIPGISGSTVLGNGRVALILDVPAICERASGRTTELPLAQ